MQVVHLFHCDNFIIRVLSLACKPCFLNLQVLFFIFSFFFILFFFLFQLVHDLSCIEVSSSLPLALRFSFLPSVFVIDNCKSKRD